VVAAIVCVADAFVWAEVRPLIDGVAPMVSRVFAGTLLVNVASYLAVVTLTEAHDFAARWREREREAASLARTAETLQGQLDEARLRALEAQLQPHFLYNTLNLVAELVHDDPDAADEMLTRLGMLLRRSYRESAHLVPLREEIRFARGYAEILARRYRDRVALTFNVPPALEGYPVPAFLLQPLMENAFRHGVERRERRSVVDVIAIRREGAVVIRVCDRGVDIAGRGLPGECSLAMPVLSDDPCDDGDGIGLRNTRERLEVLYGASARLTLTRMANETVAVVSLPVDATLAVDDPELGSDRPEARPAALALER
jgi:LytS/YehU family sensor histidine kinase